MLIHPEIIPTPDSPTVKFREPKEKVNLDIEIPKILGSQGWGIGINFDIQFISHDRTQLLASGKFIVVSENESLQTANPDGYQPMTKTVLARQAKQIGEWNYFVDSTQEMKEATEDVLANVATAKEVKWNPGKKVHQVLQGDEVLYENADKTMAENFRDAA